MAIVAEDQVSDSATNQEEKHEIEVSSGVGGPKGPGDDDGDDGRGDSPFGSRRELRFVDKNYTRDAVIVEIDPEE